MTNLEAAKRLVEMDTDVRVYGYGCPEYHEAVAIACAALFAQMNGWEKTADKEEEG